MLSLDSIFAALARHERHHGIAR